MNKKELKEIAERIGRTIGIGNVTREILCSEAGIPDGSFTHVVGVSFTEFITSIDFDNVTISRKRVPLYFRRLALIESAVQVAFKNGWYNLTRESIAEESAVSPALVTHVLGDMDTIRREVLREAIKREIVPIIAEGIINGIPDAFKISKQLRAKVNKYITRL